MCIRPTSLLLALVCATSLSAQTTFDDIRLLFTSNCVTYCHTGGSPAGNMDLSGSATDVYNALVDAVPQNANAAARGYKRVDPNYPENSYILHKLGAGGFDHGYALGVGEGERMPKDQDPLDPQDIELIRQWILFGAPPVSQVVDPALLNDFYNGSGKVRVDRPAAPGEGIQIHNGPVFLGPGEEREYTRKYALDLPDDVEVTDLSVRMNAESHHFILYEYLTKPNASEGFDLVDDIFDIADLGTDAVPLGTWQFDLEHVLPAGSAYPWDDDVVLDLNYHLRNYDTDSVLAAEVYLNVHFVDAGTVSTEMIAGLDVYGGLNPFLLFIPNDGVEHKFTMEQYEPGSTDTWYFWLLQAHTHQLGIDYDIFLRNPDGTKGDQVYEGFFDPEYTFNQGFYDYAHPAVRKFDPLLEVPASTGLIHEATYVNNGPSPVGFGLTTEDEMFVSYYHYTLERPTPPSGMEEPVTNAAISVFPNPVADRVVIEFATGQQRDVRIDLHDLTGRWVANLVDRRLPAGGHRIQTALPGFPNGTYLLRVTTDGVLKPAQRVVILR